MQFDGFKGKHSSGNETGPTKDSNQKNKETENNPLYLALQKELSLWGVVTRGAQIVFNWATKRFLNIFVVVVSYCCINLNVVSL